MYYEGFVGLPGGVALSLLEHIKILTILPLSLSRPASCEDQLRGQVGREQHQGGPGRALQVRCGGQS